MGTPERVETLPQSMDPVDDPKFVSVRGFLAIDRTRLPTREDILVELNVLPITKSLEPDLRERLADRILADREKKPESI